MGTCTAGSGSDTIVLTAGSTYSISTVDNNDWGPTGLPAITSNITIAGDSRSGATIQRTGATAFRLVYVAPTGNLTLQNLTVTNGLAQGGAGGASDDGGGGGGGAGFGGAIFNEGTLTLRGVLISNSSAIGGAGGNVNSGTVDAGGGGGGTSPTVPGDSPPGNGGAGHGRNASGTDTGGAGGTSAADCTAGTAGGLGSGGGGGGQDGDNDGNGCTGGTGGFAGGGGGGGHEAGTNAGGTGGDGGLGGGGGGGGSGAAGGGSGGFSFGGGFGGAGTTSSGGGGGGGVGAGGAIFNNGGTVTIQNSTLTGNSAVGGNGGTGGTNAGSTGVGVGGALLNRNGTVTIQFSTLAANTAAFGGGAVYSVNDGTNPSLTIRASILADTPGGATDCETIGTHATDNESNNVIEVRFGCQAPLSTADPGLGALANHGGPTSTKAITSSSNAYERVTIGVDSCKTSPFNIDERGAARADGTNRGGSNCEIGAYEVSLQTPNAATVVRFLVHFDGHRVTIEWETAAEVRVAGFQIERSLDGAEFGPVGPFVFAEGTVVSGAAYAVIDDQPPPGELALYRLAERLSDGSVVRYPPLAVRLTQPAERRYLPRLDIRAP